eukprot:403336805
MCSASFLQPIGENACIQECGNATEHIILRPDRETFKILPWMPTHAGVMMGAYNCDGTPYQYCPRFQIQDAMQSLKEKYNIEIKIGIEIEFLIMNQQYSPVEESLYLDSKSLDFYSQQLCEIAKHLKALNTNITGIHKETGRGQFEIILSYGPVLEILDKYFLAREVINNVLSKHNLIASFIPFVSHDTCSGAHVHLSLWRDGINICKDISRQYQMSNECESFMSGIMEALPAMVSFLAPSANSLRRLKDGSFLGQTMGWSIDFKDVPLRYIPRQQNFELKTMDHTANHYYTLAAILRCGELGIEKSMKLSKPIKEQDIQSNQDKEISLAQVPFNWESIRDQIQNKESGRFMKEAFRKLSKVIQIHKNIREHDINYFAKRSFAEEIKITTNRY